VTVEKDGNLAPAGAGTTEYIDDLIYPLVVVEGKGIKESVSSIPKQYRFSIDLLMKKIRGV